MLVSSPPHDPPLECPQCRRHSIVKHGDSEYVCLSCDFRRDLAQTPQSSGLLGNWVLGMLAFALVLMLAR
ncbi:MAG TPA: hypothetical protein VLS96_13070 [Nodosilinea sp.]|nr:hypothetical protein [Nodosilinea sp.]